MGPPWLRLLVHTEVRIFALLCTYRYSPRFALFDVTASTNRRGPPVRSKNNTEIRSFLISSSDGNTVLYLRIHPPYISTCVLPRGSSGISQIEINPSYLIFNCKWFCTVNEYVYKKIKEGVCKITPYFFLWIARKRFILTKVTKKTMKRRLISIVEALFEGGGG